MIDVQVAISSASNFWSLEILDVRFCAVFEGASCVLCVGWKLAFAELFVFALRDPRAPTGIQRRTEGSAALGSRSAVEAGLGLGLRLGLIRGLVAGFLTATSLLEVVATEEKSKWSSKAKSFCS